MTDVSNKEQLGVVLRYLENDKPVERLIDFIECKEVTGEALARQIVQKIDQVGLDMKNCRSQSYDGAGNMAGANKGCAARIKQVLIHGKHGLIQGSMASLQRPYKLVLIELSAPLTTLFNFCINKNVWPSKWKCGHLAPVYKKDDRNAKENYRPITLLPCVSKVLEK